MWDLDVLPVVLGQQKTARATNDRTPAATNETADERARGSASGLSTGVALRVHLDVRHVTGDLINIARARVDLVDREMEFPGRPLACALCGFDVAVNCRAVDVVIA